MPIRDEPEGHRPGAAVADHAAVAPGAAADRDGGLHARGCRLSDRRRRPTRSRRLVAEALAEIERQTRADVLIIEDEPIIAMDIETIVRDLGHNVTGVAVTRDEAVQPGAGAAARAWSSPTSSSPTTARASTRSRTSSAEFEVPVIFITAFPERLLTGERPEPTFLITKPFQRSTVKAAIAQALFFDTATVPA